ncbi:MAG: NAD(P)H-dependent oxidoreductase [Pseudomonadota bacterium]
MTTLLRIDSSARSDRSLSRALADRFFDNWRSHRPGDTIIRRDVGMTPPPFVTQDWIAAAFAKGERTPEQTALLAASDEMIDEIDRADIIVIAAPMYNYGMPATLKAWFDQVIRVNKTFTFDLARGDKPLEPVMDGKTLVILTSSGEFGFGPGELNDGAGHLVPHIRTAAFYLGVGDRIHHVGIEYQEFGDDRHRASTEAAHAAIPSLAARLVFEIDHDAHA